MKKILLLLPLLMTSCSCDTKDYKRLCFDKVISNYNDELTEYGYLFNEVRNLKYAYTIDIFTNDFIDKWFTIYDIQEQKVNDTFIARIYGE